MNALNYSIIACMAVAAIAVAVCVYAINAKALLQDGHSGITNALKKHRRGPFSYNQIQTALDRKGATFVFGELATPLNYLLLRAAVGVFALMIGLSFAGQNPLYLLLTLAIAIIATYIPGWLLNLSNSDDNTAMLEDLKSVYATLRIETHAGVYLAQALSECYLVVSNRRLKAALLDVTNDIFAHNDVGSAMDTFGQKFDNRYIDMFVVTIKQSLESGRSEQILTDVSDEMANVQKEINDKLKDDLDRNIQLVDLGAFACMIAIVVYAVMVSLLNAFAGM